MEIFIFIILFILGFILGDMYRTTQFFKKSRLRINKFEDGSQWVVLSLYQLDENGNEIK